MSKASQNRADVDRALREIMSAGPKPRIRQSDPALRTVDGRTFHSISEAHRYGQLAMLERAGVIRDLVCQPRFELQPAYVRDGKKEPPIYYYADFGYTLVFTGGRVIEDVKGHRTEIFKLKRRMLLYQQPDLDFREVPA